jgi:L-ribulose-5-phosphate 3-epimerase
MKSNGDRIGFMQGRLSELIDDRVQFFPWGTWEQEFEIASQIPIRLMEWTLDHEGIDENPFMTIHGQKKISELCKKWNVKIPSLTGDCFMQAPFWKASNDAAGKLIQDYRDVVAACGNLGVGIIVIPLVDNGSLDNHSQEESLIELLLQNIDVLKGSRVKLAFESDFYPLRLKKFIDRLPDENFGINFDMGNSASLGYRSEEEIDLYGNRIYNVHVKDRLLNGGTVPLGNGNVDFIKVFTGLGKIAYQGNFILQTARLKGDDNVSLVRHYRDLVLDRLMRE